MRNWIVIAISCIMLMGCSATQQQYAIQTGMITVEAEVLRQQFESIKELLIVQQETNKVYTDDEWAKLERVDASIGLLAAKYESMLKLDIASISIIDLHVMWQLTANSYDEAREVVIAHYGDHNQSTQALLKSFDAQAKITYDRVEQLLSNPDNESTTQILTLMSSLATIAVKIIAVSAL